MAGAISSNDREWSAITYANSSNLNALPTIVSHHGEVVLLLKS